MTTAFGSLLSGENGAIIVRLLAALLIGGAIGLERSLHGRSAGFRTHALVCVASALLMLVTVYQLHWMTEVPIDTIRADPTRMAQGIMTGIGFLGAGVIFKEGLNVRGLTTAASIWITSAIGILVGIGFYFPAVVCVLLTLAVLAVFRAIEVRLPSEHYAHHVVSFKRNDAPTESALREMIVARGFDVANMASQLSNGGEHFEYHMSIRTRDQSNIEKLSQHLRGCPDVIGFRITPVGG